MSLVTIKGRLSAAVADAGTITVSYPSRTGEESGVYDEGDFYLAMGHKFVLGQSELSFPDDFDITLGTSSITVTNKTGSSWATDQDWILELQIQGKSVYQDSATGHRQARMARADTFLISLGAPDTLDADGISVSAIITASATIGGALASGGVARFDVPRNVVITGATSVTSVTFTVTGTDEYGETVVENITGPTGATTAAGKKAFKTVTAISVSGTTTAAVTIGTGDVLGLPVFLPGTGNVLKELEDGAAATAGTVVAGIRTAGGSTATTGDVRGTYDPNSACDGGKVIQLIVALPDGGERGIAQYAG